MHLLLRSRLPTAPSSCKRSTFHHHTYFSCTLYRIPKRYLFSILPKNCSRVNTQFTHDSTLFREMRQQYTPGSGGTVSDSGSVPRSCQQSTFRWSTNVTWPLCSQCTYSRLPRRPLGGFPPSSFPSLKDDDRVGWDERRTERTKKFGKNCDWMRQR